MNNSKLISPISNILENASKLILDFYKNKNIIQSSLKQDSSPVTEADKRAHIFITKELLENFPLIPVISEEGDEGEEIISDIFWLVDPLDGTKEFINQGDDFTINIALINNQEPVFGAIYKPVTGELYMGGKNLPAFKIQNKVKNYLKTELNEIACIVSQSKSHGSDKENEFINSLSKKFENNKVIKAGSSIKICLVAEGKSHIYPRFGDVYQWDIAAGHAILNASGGEITDLNLKKIIYSSSRKKKLKGFFALSELSFWKEKLQ